MPKNKTILLMITDNEKWHYLVVKNFLFFCNITSKYDEVFYCLKCLHPYKTENKLKEHGNVCKNHEIYSFRLFISYIVHLMPQETSIIITEAKIV